MTILKNYQCSGFSRDISGGWARGCYAHVFLVYRYISTNPIHSSMPRANSGTGPLLTKRKVKLKDIALVLFSLLWTTTKLFT